MTLAEQAQKLLTKKPALDLDKLPNVIPADLIELDQWVLWRYEGDTKRPYSAHTGKLAKSNDRKDWVSFDEAVDELRKHPRKYSGIGFVFSEDDGLAGIDLDDCILPDGAYKPWAQQLLDRIQSYSEISPSGKGIKIWCRAKLSGGGVKRYVLTDGSLTTEARQANADGAIEIYDHGRYFTVTGRSLDRSGVEDCQAEVSALYDFLSGPDPESTSPRRVMPERFDAGTRHPNLMHLGASLWAKGLSDDAVLAALLAENQAKCIPPKPDKEIRDILTWLQKLPKGVFPELPPDPRVAEATESSAGTYALPSGDPGDPLRPNDIARLILHSHRLLVHNELIYEYDGQRWARIKAGAIEQYALSLDSHDKTKRSRRAEAADYVVQAARNESIEWRQLGDLEIPCANGVVNIATCAIREHRPEDYLESVIPHAYDPGQHPHVWAATLERWFRYDADAPAKIDALQEFFGYCLLPHARYKKALFLYGDSDTGKSQVPLVLKALVGTGNICTLNTEQMADERKRAPIVGKMINIMTELPVDAMISDGGFKQLVSTGDPISIDPKWVDSYSYVPFCKHVICTNNLPSITDTTAATYNRLLLLKFNNVIPKSEQDDRLIDKLVAEVQGILAWAIEGAARLVQNRGKFSEIAESDAAIAEYRSDENPMNEFLAENCIQEEGESIKMSELRHRFIAWLGRPMSPRRIGTLLLATGAEISIEKDAFVRKAVRVAKNMKWSS